MKERPEKKLHTHDSIPCYTGEEENGCVLCIGNKACDEWEEFLPTLIEIKIMLNNKCRTCKQDFAGCQYTCSILPNEILKRLKGEK